MKLSVIQITLGILVVAMSVFTMAWYFPDLVPTVPAEITSEAERLIADIKMAEITHYNNHWFVIFGWMITIILIGLLVAVSGIVRFRKQKAGNTNIRLAIIQTVLGVFLIIISLVTPVWYESILFPSKLTLPDGSHSMDSYSIQYMLIFIIWFISLGLMGIAVFICSITRLYQENKLKSMNMDRIEANNVVELEKI